MPANDHNTTKFLTTLKNALGDKDAQYELSMEYLQELDRDSDGNPIRDVGNIDNENIKTSFKYFQKSADQGHLDSIYQVGLAYHYNLGVDASLHDDEDLDFKFFKLAADRRHVGAQFMVGKMWNEGCGYTEDGVIGFDEKKATDWLQMASEKNHPEAQFMLSQILFDASASDNHEAIQLLKLSARANFEKSQMFLGYIYSTGTGATRNTEYAVKFYKMVVANKIKHFDENNERIKVDVDGRYPEATNGLYKSQQDRHEFAQAWLDDHKEFDHDSIPYKKGNSQTAVTKTIDLNSEKIKALIIRANGYAKSRGILAELYMKGRGCDQSNSEALKWLLIGAEEDNVYSNWQLGQAYYEGTCGLEQNFVKAAYYVEKAASVGEIDAQRLLGHMYEYGEGVEQDIPKAMYWYISENRQVEYGVQY